MLCRSSLLILVGTSSNDSPFSQRAIKLFDTKKNASIFQMTFKSPVVDVHITMASLFVVTAHCVHILNVRTLKTAHIIRTSPNPRGICAVRPRDFLVFPALKGRRERKGVVGMFDVKRIKPLDVFDAHVSSLSAICISKGGDLIATASERGTIVRVFEMPGGALKHSFRRGTMSAYVNCLSFSDDSKYLAVCSNSGTIHVFDMFSERRSQDATVTKSGESNSDMFRQRRCFAWARLKKCPACCAIQQGKQRDEAVLLVVSRDGYVVRFTVDGKDGGECRVVDEARLLLGHTGKS